MKIYVLILSLMLFATPVLAGDFPVHDGAAFVVSAQNQKKEKSASGKVVIKGKGGKVTDVEQKSERERERAREKNREKKSQ